MLEQAELLTEIQELLVDRARQTAVLVAALVAEKIEQVRLEERRGQAPSQAASGAPEAPSAAWTRGFFDDSVEKMISSSTAALVSNEAPRSPQQSNSAGSAAADGEEVEFTITRDHRGLAGYQIPNASHMHVKGVGPGSPAYKAGMRDDHVDWIITHVDGAEVTAETGRAALNATRGPGKTFTIRAKSPHKDRRGRTPPGTSTPPARGEDEEQASGAAAAAQEITRTVSRRSFQGRERSSSMQAHAPLSPALAPPPTLAPAEPMREPAPQQERVSNAGEAPDTEDLQALWEVFRACDANGSGRISMRDLVEACLERPEAASLFGLPSEIQQLEGESRRAVVESFQGAGGDNGGEISWEELCSTLRARAPARSRRSSAQAPASATPSMREPTPQQDLPPAPVSAQVRSQRAGDLSPSPPNLEGARVPSAAQAHVPSAAVPSLSPPAAAARAGAGQPPPRSPPPRARAQAGWDGGHSPPMSASWDGGNSCNETPHRRAAKTSDAAAVAEVRPEHLFSSLREITEALQSANIIPGSQGASP